MPDIYFDVDTALSEVPVNIFPLTDDTDFKSRETTVAYNASGMDLVWNFVTTGGAYTQTAVTPTTAGTYDWAHQGDGMYSIEIPASGGASINNDTEGFGWFTGVATGVLPWRSPIFGFRAAAINDSLIDAGTTGLLGPTTAGRTLDVASTGEAGLDFGNVALPSSGPIAALGILESGTAQSVSSTTLVGRSAATDDIVKLGHTLWAYGSTQGYWQSVMIVSVSGDTFTISGWPQATPSGTITYLVFGTPTVPNSLPFAADVRQIGGSSQSATDLKDFADTGYDPSTHKVQGVVLTDTCTTLTGHTAQTGDSYARIGATGSGLTSLASQASVDTIDNFLDTEVAAILALLDDPRGEPGQGAPPVNPDLATKIDYLYKAWRNRSTQTATTYSLYADNGTTVDQKATVSDDGTTYVKGEIATGP